MAPVVIQASSRQTATVRLRFIAQKILVNVIVQHRFFSTDHLSSWSWGHRVSLELFI